jgi:myosin heavy subunit
MGGSGAMQRGSSSTARTVMALCLGSLLVLTVLYLAKRVELNKSLRELELVKVESRDISEGLNNKIVEYVEKIESLTQEATVLGSELTTCKDSRAALMEQGKKVKAEKDECSRSLVDANQELDEANAAVGQVASDREQAVSEKEALETELQKENADLQTQVDECEADNERLHVQSDDRGRCNVQLAETQMKLRNSNNQATSLLNQVSVLTDMKKKLEERIVALESSSAGDTHAVDSQPHLSLNYGGGTGVDAGGGGPDLSPQEDPFENPGEAGRKGGHMVEMYMNNNRAFADSERHNVEGLGDNGV